MLARPVIDQILASARWKPIEAEARRALAWWVDELAALVPMAAKRLWAQWRPVEPELTLSRADFQWRQPGRPDIAWPVVTDELGATGIQDAGEFSREVPAGQKLTIRLDRQLFLVRELKLPLAASASLPSIIRHQIPRLVPLAERDIASTFEVLSRDPSSKTMLVRIVLTRQTTIARARLIAKQLSFDLERVVAVAPGMKPQSLFRVGGAGWMNVAGLARRHAGIAVAAVLALVAVTLHLVRESYIHARVKSEISDLRSRTTTILALDQKIRSERRMIAYVDARRRELPPSVMLDDLARLFPLDTWISELTYQDRSVTCAGESRRAAELIGRIEASDVFASPKFTSAITMSADGSAQRFELKLAVRPDARS